MKPYPARLALRNGLAPSRLQLPAGSWLSLLDFLCARFPHIAPAIWQNRLAQGQVFDEEGRALALDSAYRPYALIWYYREVDDEVSMPFEATLLYQDERLLVMDKPHFLASTPAGRHVHETLLTRVRRMHPQANALHRLDRETAGVMLFCLEPTLCGTYQTLFQQQRVHKVYQAIARFDPALDLPCCHSSRLQEKPDSFLMHEVAGEPNSLTQIELMERRGPWARYRLRPASGKKHQLRVHLAALGIGIYGDPWYPVRLADKACGDFSAPLRLLASHIALTDPVSGQRLRFDSQRTLDWPDEPLDLMGDHGD